MTHRTGKTTIECQPTRAPRGRTTHALSPTKASRTACGIRMSGWLAGTEPIECAKCKAALLREALRRSE